MTFDTFEQLVTYLREICNKKKIYIWGASVYGNYLGKLFNMKKILWEGYYDNFSVDVNKKYNGKIVKSGKDLHNCEEFIFVLSMRSYEGVWKQLNDAGIRDEQIVAISDVQVFNRIEDAVINTKQYAMRIEKFKGIHQGERCFIIGNGPSLRLDDLESLQGEYTFACNLIFQCFEKTKWRPNYYFFIESNSTTFDSREKVKCVTDNCHAAFVRAGGSLYSYRDDEEIDNLYFMRMELPQNVNNISFSEDCSQKVYSGTTITYTMIQMAVYMGFTEIYLMGIDHTFSKIVDRNGETLDGDLPINTDHAKFLGKYNLPVGTEVYKIENAYRAAKEYAMHNGIKIYNATRGGKLEIFERIDFESLID